MNRKQFNILILTVDNNYHSPIILRELLREFQKENIFVFIGNKKKSGYSISKIIRRYPFRYIMLKIHEKIIFQKLLLKEKIKGPKNIFERNYLDLDTILSYFSKNKKLI